MIIFYFIIFKCYLIYYYPIYYKYYHFSLIIFHFLKLLFIFLVLLIYLSKLHFHVIQLLFLWLLSMKDKYFCNYNILAVNILRVGTNDILCSSLNSVTLNLIKVIIDIIPTIYKKNNLLITSLYENTFITINGIIIIT